MQRSRPVYITDMGEAYCGDALSLLPQLPAESVDLVLTSPPFALQREKEYGNVDQGEYVDWLLQFADPVARVLKKSGSFVIDLGGAYQRGKPVRSLHNFHFLVRMCEEKGWRLAEEFFWFNPSKLPSPIEWVNKRKIRAKDAVNTVWWLSKSDFPKADVRNVLVPYSNRMRLLLSNSRKYYSPKLRPSGHDISARFGEDNGGAIPPNLLQIPNSESNSAYLRNCSAADVVGHPARFPEGLPKFFINFLTVPGDTVLDIFAGSNTTGSVAEAANRKWIAFDSHRPYLAASAFRFLESGNPKQLSSLYARLIEGVSAPIKISTQPAQSSLLLAEAPPRWRNGTKGRAGIRKKEAVSKNARR